MCFSLMQAHLHGGVPYSQTANLTSEAGKQIVNLTVSRTSSLARAGILVMDNYLRTVSCT